MVLMIRVNGLVSSGNSKFSLVGKKILCVNANDVMNTNCNIVLINQTAQLYNIHITLRPNIALQNLHVKLQ